MANNLLLRLAAHDRALYARLALAPGTAVPSTRLWRGVTHLGGATSTIVIALAPVIVGRGPLRAAALLACANLLASHLLVQLVKRNAVRARPEPAQSGTSHVGVPDQFSFPSGHASSAMAVALPYAIAYPDLAAPIILAAVIIGLSRIRLGVHYPSDVLAGQAISIATAFSLHAVHFSLRGIPLQ